MLRIFFLLFYFTFWWVRIQATLFLGGQLLKYLCKELKYAEIISYYRS